MKHSLLLFDIDGTLLRTDGAGLRAMSRVACSLFGDHWSWEGVEPAGNLDPLIFAEAAVLNGLADVPSHQQRFHDCYIDQLEAELRATAASCQVMPGIVDLLDQLEERARQQRDITLGLVTGNYTKAAPIKLRSVGIEPDRFHITAFGDEGRTRPDLVGLAMRKFERYAGHPISPQHVIVIGDTPRDVACAHAHGCVALAVGTGGHSLESLRAAGADVVVQDLADPTPLLRLLDG